MNEVDLIALTDKINPILTEEVLFKRYDSLTRRDSVNFTAEEYADFCIKNQMRRGDSIFIIKNRDSPKTLCDLRIARGGFRPTGRKLEFKHMKNRYERLVKKHGENLRFNFAEFRKFCEKNDVTVSDVFFTPKEMRRKVFLDDLIIKRNVHLASWRWFL